MKVFIEKDNSISIIKKNNITVSELLKELNINYSNVIIVKNNEVILEDEILFEEDEINILSVVSGG